MLIVWMNIVDDVGVLQLVRGRHCWSWCGVFGLIFHCMAARPCSLSTYLDISPSRHRRHLTARYHGIIWQLQCYYIEIFMHFVNARFATDSNRQLESRLSGWCDALWWLDCDPALFGSGQWFDSIEMRVGVSCNCRNSVGLPWYMLSVLFDTWSSGKASSL